MTSAVFSLGLSQVLGRVFFPLALGIIGASILLWLGLWQVERLEWKKGVLADLEARIGAEPSLLPEVPNIEAHQYLSVEVTGDIGPDEITVLASTRQVGAIYRIIAPFRTTEGRVILLDRGYVLDELKETPRPIGAATITGNLLWPDEIDKYTPRPDIDAGIWFARDIPVMAEHLGTEPVLLVARESSQNNNGITPLPVSTEGIPNDHLEYAITWFGLALVWVLMSALLLWRQIRKNES